MRSSLVIAVAATLSLAAGAARADSFSGSYVGNGREAKLAHIAVAPDSFGDKKFWAVVVSEKDSTTDKPQDEALFDHLGDAIVINIDEEGAVLGVQVCHQELEKSGFSSSGHVKADPFSIENGVLKAHVSSGGDREFFGDHWSLDMDVEVTLPKP